jgi:hypothetical protein
MPCFKVVKKLNFARRVMVFPDFGEKPTSIVFDPSNDADAEVPRLRLKFTV